jgi:acetyl-CoA acetyltransferase family protein
MQDIYIPYGAYWSTPFARWQKSLAHLHSLRFAAHVAKRALAQRKIDPLLIDFGALGLTVPQKGAFYGLPWLMALVGAETVAGPTISQACATGVRTLQSCTAELRQGNATVSLAICADRTSNGPHIYYPEPDATGGTGQHEDWILDNFDMDPYSHVAMIATAENVARRHGFSTAQQNELTLRRYEQYNQATANDSAFLRRFMELPFDVPDANFRKVKTTLLGDEGIFNTSAAGLAKLTPVLENGTVTYGGQTHPADGNAAILLSTLHKLPELSVNPNIGIKVVAFGQSRVEPAYMPAAPVPAARKALEMANLNISQVAVVKTHNPFVVNDLCLAEALGIDANAFNNFGSSLVWGHPQGPTGLRGVIEMIEELVIRGGGYGLFVGCAAGDAAMAVILEVKDLP